MYVTGLYITCWEFTVGRIKLDLSFSSPQTEKRIFGTLDIQNGDIKIKQYSKVTYLGCELHESLLGEAMALKVKNKINGMLKFFTGKTDA